MISLKKLTFSLIPAILVTGVSTAQANYGKCNSLHCGAYAEVEPFYMRTRDTLLTDFDYAVTDGFTLTQNDTLLSDEDRFFNISNKNKWGFRVALGYDFPSCDPCSNHGISLEYTHFDTKNEDTTPILNNHGVFVKIPVLVPLLSAFDQSQNYEQGHAKLDTKYDTIDLLAHKNLIFCSTQVQIFAGARYLHFRENLTADYRFTSEPILSAEDETFVTIRKDRANFNNKFDGIGPRIGANIYYPIFCGFGISGEAAGEIAYGETHSDFSEFQKNENFPIEDNVIEHRVIDRHRTTSLFTPGLSGKVGLEYRARFCNNTTLSVEVGYRGDKYFGIADNSALVEALTSTPSVAVGTGYENLNKDSKFHDFSFNGPYLNVTLHA